MTNITTIIDQESGIQYQGAEDRSSRTGTYPVIGLIAGKFRRGRYDKPMIITNENIKAQLGYDPTNPHYMAVQDVLSSGVQSVQVLRVDGGGLSGNFPKMNCSMASIGIYIAPDFYYGEEGEVTYSVYVNNILVGVGSSNGVYIEELLVDYFRNQNMQARAGYSDGAFVVNLNESKPLQLRFIPSISYDSTQMKFYDLHSNHLISGSEELNFESGELNLIEHNALTIGEDGSIHVCLAPYIPPIVVEPVSYILTIDDKGLVPIDGIYSGTITPPLPNIELGFNIQQYLSNGSNGRVFNIHTSPDGLRISPDGGSWTVDKALVASYWDFPTAEDFTTPATYSLSIATIDPALAVTPAQLDYVVEVPFSTQGEDLIFTLANRTANPAIVRHRAVMHAGDRIYTNTGILKVESDSDDNLKDLFLDSGTYILRRSPTATQAKRWAISGVYLEEIIQFPATEYVNSLQFYLLEHNSVNLINVPNSFPSNITNISNLFAECIKFNEDISSWDVSSVSNMNRIFAGAQAFNQDLSQWCVPLITNEPSEFSISSPLTSEHKPVWGTCPFKGTKLLRFTKDSALGDVRVGAVAGNTEIRTYLVDAITGVVSAEILGSTVANLPSGDWYLYCKEELLPAGVTVANLSVLVSGEGLIEVTEWSSKTIKESFLYNGYASLSASPNLVKVPPTRPNTLQTNFSFMFTGASKLNDPNISNWDVSQVTQMASMFKRCSSFNQPLNTWDVSKVKSFYEMFNSATVFNQSLSSWNTSLSVSFYSMFAYAKAFNQPLDGWDVSNATDMAHMFNSAFAFNQPLASWKVGKVGNMVSMFQSAQAFNQNLTGWCVTKILSRPASFEIGSALINANRPVWGTCPNGS